MATADQIEVAAKAIWENQYSRKSEGGIQRTWRDASAPAIFWESYVDDAKAALTAVEEYNGSNREADPSAHSYSLETGCSIDSGASASLATTKDS